MSDSKKINMAKEALREAIKLAGGQVKLGKICGVRQQHISWWLVHSNYVPPKYAPKIEKALNGAVTRHQLCPEVDWDNH